MKKWFFFLSMFIVELNEDFVKVKCLNFLIE